MGEKSTEKATSENDVESSVRLLIETDQSIIHRVDERLHLLSLPFVHIEIFFITLSSYIRG
jgi:hypothetical protein